MENKAKIITDGNNKYGIPILGYRSCQVLYATKSLVQLYSFKSYSSGIIIDIIFRFTNQKQLRKS